MADLDPANSPLDAPQAPPVAAAPPRPPAAHTNSLDPAVVPGQPAPGKPIPSKVPLSKVSPLAPNPQPGPSPGKMGPAPPYAGGGALTQPVRQVGFALQRAGNVLAPGTPAGGLAGLAVRSLAAGENPFTFGAGGGPSPTIAREAAGLYARNLQGRGLSRQAVEDFLADLNEQYATLGGPNLAAIEKGGGAAGTVAHHLLEHPYLTGIGDFGLGMVGPGGDLGWAGRLARTGGRLGARAAGAVARPAFKTTARAARFGVQQAGRVPGVSAAAAAAGRVVGPQIRKAAFVAAPAIEDVANRAGAARDWVGNTFVRPSYSVERPIHPEDRPRFVQALTKHRNADQIAQGQIHERYLPRAVPPRSTGPGDVDAGMKLAQAMANKRAAAAAPAAVQMAATRLRTAHVQQLMAAPERTPRHLIDANQFVRSWLDANNVVDNAERNAVYDTALRQERGLQTPQGVTPIHERIAQGILANEREIRFRLQRAHPDLLPQDQAEAIPGYIPTGGETYEFPSAEQEHLPSVGGGRGIRTPYLPRDPKKYRTLVEAERAASERNDPSLMPFSGASPLDVLTNDYRVKLRNVAQQEAINDLTRIRRTDGQPLFQPRIFKDPSGAVIADEKGVPSSDPDRAARIWKDFARSNPEVRAEAAKSQNLTLDEAEQLPARLPPIRNLHGRVAEVKRAGKGAATTTLQQAMVGEKGLGRMRSTLERQREGAADTIARAKAETERFGQRVVQTTEKPYFATYRVRKLIESHPYLGLRAKVAELRDQLREMRSDRAAMDAALASIQDVKGLGEETRRVAQELLETERTAQQPFWDALHGNGGKIVPRMVWDPLNRIWKIGGEFAEDPALRRHLRIWRTRRGQNYLKDKTSNVSEGNLDEILNDVNTHLAGGDLASGAEQLTQEDVLEFFRTHPRPPILKDVMEDAKAAVLGRREGEVGLIKAEAQKLRKDYVAKRLEMRATRKSLKRAGRVPGQIASGVKAAENVAERAVGAAQKRATKGAQNVAGILDRGEARAEKARGRVNEGVSNTLRRIIDRSARMTIRLDNRTKALVLRQQIAMQTAKQINGVRRKLDELATERMHALAEAGPTGQRLGESMPTFDSRLLENVRVGQGTLGVRGLDDHRLPEELAKYFEQYGAAPEHARGIAHLMGDLHYLARSTMVWNPVVHGLGNLFWNYLDRTDDWAGMLRAYPHLVGSMGGYTEQVGEQAGRTLRVGHDGRSFDAYMEREFGPYNKMVVDNGAWHPKEPNVHAPFSDWMNRNLKGRDRVGDLELLTRDPATLNGVQRAQQLALRVQAWNSEVVFNRMERWYATSLMRHFVAKEGMDPVRAAAEVRRVVGTDQVSNFERQITKAILFYPWMKTVVPMAIRLGITKPRVWDAPLQATQHERERQGQGQEITSYSDPLGIVGGAEPGPTVPGEGAPTSMVPFYNLRKPYVSVLEPIAQALFGAPTQDETGQATSERLQAAKNYVEGHYGPALRFGLGLERALTPGAEGTPPYLRAFDPKGSPLDTAREIGQFAGEQFAYPGYIASEIQQTGPLGALGAITGGTTGRALEGRRRGTHQFQEGAALQSYYDLETARRALSAATKIYTQEPTEANKRAVDEAQAELQRVQQKYGK